MGRAKAGIAVVGVLMTLLGVVALVTTQSNGSSRPAGTVSGAASGEATTTGSPVDATVAPAAPGENTSASVAPATASTGSKAPNAQTPTTASGKAPAAAAPPSGTARPTPEQIQATIAGITAQLQASAARNGGAPVTKEQIEAELRAQLKQLGINY